MDRRVPSRLTRSVGACVLVLGLLIAAGMGNASAAPVPVNTRAAALSALKHLMIGKHGTDHALGGPTGLGGFGPKKVTSGNWSGYADDNGRSYTTVTAHWKEPTVTCPSKGDTMAAFWVGIDGYDSATVEQDGSLAWCDSGTPYHYTWWEMEPKYPIEFVSGGVKPGDQIEASVTRDGTKYTLKVSDTTTSGNSFTKYQYCAARTCADSSAEWVAEAPTRPDGKQYPLAKFTPWTVQGATVKTSSQSGTISTFPDYFITMTSDSTVLAKPGLLNHTGSSFTDTWLASS